MHWNPRRVQSLWSLRGCEDRRRAGPRTGSTKALLVRSRHHAAAFLLETFVSFFYFFNVLWYIGVWKLERVGRLLPSSSPFPCFPRLAGRRNGSEACTARPWGRRQLDLTRRWNGSCQLIGIRWGGARMQDGLCCGSGGECRPKNVGPFHLRWWRWCGVRSWSPIGWQKIVSNHFISSI
jgi:hypothetical protein